VGFLDFIPQRGFQGSIADQFWSGNAVFLPLSETADPPVQVALELLNVYF
jgi:hypothetical protein